MPPADDEPSVAEGHLAIAKMAFAAKELANQATRAAESRADDLRRKLKAAEARLHQAQEDQAWVAKFCPSDEAVAKTAFSAATAVAAAAAAVAAAATAASRRHRGEESQEELELIEPEGTGRQTEVEGEGCSCG